MAEASVVAASESDRAKLPGAELAAESSNMASSKEKDTPAGKKKKTSKPEQLERRLDSLEQSLDCKFQQLFNFFHTAKDKVNFENISDGSAMRSSHDTGNVALSGEHSHSPHRNDDASDILSIHPNDQESQNMRYFLGDMDEGNVDRDLREDSSSRSPCVMSHDNSVGVKNKTHDILSQLFGENEKKEENNSGLLLDQSQIDILDKSWRCSRPERLSAFKEEYREVFPLHEDAKQMLQVPQLDELLETMLQERHGLNSAKWGKSRQLVTQPLKSIEGLAFQGQMAARYSVISVLYMQQALGALMKKIQSESSPVSVSETVKDIYAMSTRTLDQCGRTGAFFHMIRRRAAATDTGLASVNLQSKLLCLPLTADGVFGKGLQDQLKQRKEQKDQLKDLIPELSIKKSGPQKRKFPPPTSTFPAPGNSWSNAGWSQPKYFKPNSAPSNQGRARSGQSRQPDYKQKSGDKPRTDSMSTFRIPKKN